MSTNTEQIQMKFDLIVKDASPAELSKILAMIAGNTSTAVNVAQVATNTEEDESGDADAAPGTVDKTGLPWDERIHSNPAKLTGKGLWRARRGVDDATVSAVEAELRARGVPQQQPAAPVYQPQPAAPVFDPTTQTTVAQPVYQPQQPAAPGYPAVQQIMQPQQPAAPVYQPQPAAPAPQPVQHQPGPAAGTVDFSGFMIHLQTLLASGRADAPYLTTVAQRIGAAFQQPVNAITDIAANQQMVDYAIQVMAADQRW